MKIEDAVSIIDTLVNETYPNEGLRAWQTLKEELAQQPHNTPKVSICPMCRNPIGSMITCTVCLAYTGAN